MATPTQKAINTSERRSLPRWKLTKADWSEYRERCKQYLSDTDLSTSSVQHMSDSISKVIQCAAEKSVPQRKDRAKGKCKSVPY